jgi:hypothetical protein
MDNDFHLTCRSANQYTIMPMGIMLSILENPARIPAGTHFRGSILPDPFRAKEPEYNL